MKIEVIEKLTIERTPVLGKYHEAVALLLDGGVGTKVRVTEESKFTARKAQKAIYAHLYQRGITARSKIVDNICEVERVS